MTETPWWSHGHKQPSQRLGPVTLGELLWRLMKDGHVAEAHVRAIDGIGLDLRFKWNGDLRSSQVFKSWPELERAARDKRSELEARGWSAANARVGR